jgi:hypothetical protein
VASIRTECGHTAAHTGYFRWYIIQGKCQEIAISPKIPLLARRADQWYTLHIKLRFEIGDAAMKLLRVAILLLLASMALPGC